MGYRAEQFHDHLQPRLSHHGFHHMFCQVEAEEIAQKTRKNSTLETVA